jgi:hypothetical protein
MAIYRAPSSDFKVFMDGFDSIIMKIYKIGLMIVVCVDFNINYLSGNDMRKQLDSMNTLYFSKFLITPLVNGLSDYDAQLLTIN